MYDVWEARPFCCGSKYKIFPKKSHETSGFPVDVNRRFTAALRRWEIAGKIPRSSRPWHLDKLNPGERYVLEKMEENWTFKFESSAMKILLEWNTLWPSKFAM